VQKSYNPIGNNIGQNDHTMRWWCDSF